MEFQEQEGEDERRPKYHEGAREFSENELKGDALKLLLDTFKNLPDLPKLHYGGLRVTEKPGKYMEWRTLMSMAFDSGSAELSSYWFELLRGGRRST